MKNFWILLCNSVISLAVEQTAIVLEDAWQNEVEELSLIGSGDYEDPNGTETIPTGTPEFTSTEATTASATSTAETTAMFSTSEIVIISLFSVFGFLFLISTLVAIGLHKLGLTMVGLTLLIGTGSLGTISYFLLDGELNNTAGYALLGTTIAMMTVAVAFGALYSRRSKSRSTSHRMSYRGSRRSRVSIDSNISTSAL